MTAASDRTERLLAWYSQRRDALRRIGLFVALVAFTVGAVLAVRSTPDLFTRLRLAPFLVLLAVGVPLTTALNVHEFHLMARMSGRAVSLPWALETTLYASAANMLPIPGGVMTRAAALRAGGVTLKHGSALILLFAAVWGGTALLYSGVAIGLKGHPALGSGMGVLGAAVLCGCTVGFRRLRVTYAKIGELGLNRLMSAIVEACRLMLAAWAVGAVIGFGSASAFSMSSFLGTAVSIVPAGLGVREAVVALLSPLVGLNPAIGFLAAVINRLAMMSGLSLAAGGVYAIRRRPA